MGYCHRAKRYQGPPRQNGEAGVSSGPLTENITAVWAQVFKLHCNVLIHLLGLQVC